jgi:hypothetical protein
VNHVRVEFTQEPGNLRIVPQKQEIELVVAVEGKFGGSAPQLDTRHRAIHRSFAPRSGVHEEKLKAVFPRERGKLAAGVRHAVNFAVRAGKQRYP